MHASLAKLLLPQNGPLLSSMQSHCSVVELYTAPFSQPANTDGGSKSVSMPFFLVLLQLSHTAGGSTETEAALALFISCVEYTSIPTDSLCVCVGMEIRRACYCVTLSRR